METPAASPSRRERERLARREAILDAALAVFAEHGYEQARLEDIAERAEFGKGTLYNYFEGGKQDLLFAIFERVHGELRAFVAGYFAAEAGRGRPVRAVFRDFVEALVGHLDRHRDAFLVLMKEVQRCMLGADAATVGRVVALREEVVGAFSPALEAAMAAGAMRRLPTAFVGQAIFGVVFHHLLHSAFRDGCLAPSAAPAVAVPAASPADAADAIAALLFDGLLVEPDRPFAPTPA